MNTHVTPVCACSTRAKENYQKESVKFSNVARKTEKSKKRICDCGLASLLEDT